MPICDPFAILLTPIRILSMGQVGNQNTGKNGKRELGKEGERKTDSLLLLSPLFSYPSTGLSYRLIVQMVKGGWEKWEEEGGNK